VARAYNDDLAGHLLRKLWQEVEHGEAKVYEQMAPLPGQSGWYVTVEANATGANLGSYRLDLYEWCEVYGIRLVLDELLYSAQDRREQYETMRAAFDECLNRQEIARVFA
jgi:hypothetical protein